MRRMSYNVPRIDMDGFKKVMGNVGIKFKKFVYIYNIQFSKTHGLLNDQALWENTDWKRMSPFYHSSDEESGDDDTKVVIMVH